MNPVVMCDLETSGLKAKEDVIFELGAVHIDLATLKPLSYFQRVVHHSAPHRLCRDDVALNMHTKSGLLDLVAERPGTEYTTSFGGGIVMENVAALDHDFALWLRDVVGAEPRSVYFAGNGFAQFDKRFMEEGGMSKTLAFSHYRTIDVRTELTLSSAWSGEPVPAALVAHRAIADCLLSLEGLRWGKSFRR